MLVIGVDIEKIVRFDTRLKSEASDRFLARIFTDSEVAEAREKGNHTEYYAARF